MIAAAMTAGWQMDWLALGVLGIMSIVSFAARGKDLVGKAALSFASIIILTSVALFGPSVPPLSARCRRWAGSENSRCHSASSTWR